MNIQRIIGIILSLIGIGFLLLSFTSQKEAPSDAQYQIGLLLCIFGALLETRAQVLSKIGKLDERLEKLDKKLSVDKKDNS